MRGRSFKLTNTTLSAVVVVTLLLSPALVSAYTSNLTVSGDVDQPGAGVVTGIGVVFAFRQLTDTQIAFTSTILGFAEGRGMNISYLWDFGDGGTSEDKNPVHEYAYDGWNADFNVTLETCNKNACAEVYKNVHIIRWSMVIVTLGAILTASMVSILYLVKWRRKH